MKRIVQVYSHFNNDDKYKVDLSLNYSSYVSGYFTEEQDASFKFRHLVNLTQEQANSVAGLANSLYEMGFAQAKKEWEEEKTKLNEDSDYCK